MSSAEGVLDSRPVSARRTLAGAAINNVADRGSPARSRRRCSSWAGDQRNHVDPASPEPDWEWVEIFNNTARSSTSRIRAMYSMMMTMLRLRRRILHRGRSHGATGVLFDARFKRRHAGELKAAWSAAWISSRDDLDRSNEWGRYDCDLEQFDGRIGETQSTMSATADDDRAATVVAYDDGAAAADAPPITVQARFSCRTLRRIRRRRQLDDGRQYE